MNEFQIPFGYRFVPTDEELALYYLWRKVNDYPLPCPCPVKEFDVYCDKNPWELFDKDSSDSVYIFTKLKKMKKSKVRVSRTAGSGTWKSRNRTDKKDGQGNLLYFKKDFMFETKNKEEDNGTWLMAEFSFQDEGESNYVLCKIWKKKLKDSQEQDQSCGESVAATKRKTSAEKEEELQRNNRMRYVEALPLSTWVPGHDYPYSIGAAVPTQFDTVTDYGFPYQSPITEEAPFQGFGDIGNGYPIPKAGEATWQARGHGVVGKSEASCSYSNLVAEEEALLIPAGMPESGDCFSMFSYSSLILEENRFDQPAFSPLIPYTPALPSSMASVPAFSSSGSSI